MVYQSILKKHLKIVVGCSTYADNKGLLRMIPSLQELVDEFVIVEGVYDLYHLDGQPKFHPQTKEACKSFDNVYYYEYAGYQSDKRQYVADIVSEKHNADVLFIVDSDEYRDPRFNDPDLFRYRLALAIDDQHDPWKGDTYKNFTYFSQDIYSILMWIPDSTKYRKAFNLVQDNEWMPYPRLWYRPGQFEYFNGIHYWVKRKNDPMPIRNYQAGTELIEDGIRLATDSLLRNEEQLECRDKWAWSGLQLEKYKIRQYKIDNPSASEMV